MRIPFSFQDWIRLGLSMGLWLLYATSHHHPAGLTR